MGNGRGGGKDKLEPTKTSGTHEDKLMPQKQTLSTLMTPVTCDKACVLHHRAAHAPGPGLRETGGEHLVGNGGAGSLGAAPHQ